MSAIMRAETIWHSGAGATVLTHLFRRGRQDRLAAAGRNELTSSSLLLLLPPKTDMDARQGPYAFHVGLEDGKLVIVLVLTMTAMLS